MNENNVEILANTQNENKNIIDKIDVLDIQTLQKIEEISIPEKIKKQFEYENPENLLHEVVIAYLANQRQGTHSTKTRSEVRGGGKKPWRQKHTGRARQGSIRSPLWRKGGIAFGPHPRDYYINIPKKKKILAKYVAIAQKILSGDILILNELKVNSIKTKEMFSLVKKLNLHTEKTLFITKDLSRELKLSSRNLKNLEVMNVNDINTYNLLNNKKMIITKEAFLCM